MGMKNRRKWAVENDRSAYNELIEFFCLKGLSCIFYNLFRPPRITFIGLMIPPMHTAKKPQMSLFNSPQGEKSLFHNDFSLRISLHKVSLTKVAAF
jgi:hypothetical protein